MGLAEVEGQSTSPRRHLGVAGMTVDVNRVRLPIKKYCHPGGWQYCGGLAEEDLRFP